MDSLVPIPRQLIVGKPVEGGSTHDGATAIACGNPHAHYLAAASHGQRVYDFVARGSAWHTH